MQPKLVTRVGELVKSSEGCSTYQRTGNRFIITSTYRRDIAPKTTAFIVDVVCDIYGVSYYELLYYGGSDWVLGSTRRWPKLDLEEDTVSS